MGQKRNYYAWLWTPYGVITDGQTGNPVGKLHRFASRQARASWVTEAAGIPRTQGGHREPCPYTWQRFDAEPVVHGAAPVLFTVLTADGVREAPLDALHLFGAKDKARP